jgi:hypothetical protein
VCSSCLRDGCRRRLPNGVSFCMNFVLFELFGSYGLEGSEPHFQRDLNNLDPSIAQAAQNLRREVQPRRRRRNRRSLPCVDGLIALPIKGLILALDVRRQGYMA